MQTPNTESETPGAFAQDLLCPGALAARYLAESAGNTVIADYERQEIEYGYGGWPEYNQSEVKISQQLKETKHSGRRADSMCYQTVQVDGKEVGAFVTDYGTTGASLRQAHSQMAVWAFCDAIGLHVPRHHWFPKKDIVAVEEVGGIDEETFDPISVRPAVADRIADKALLDFISVQLLAGTDDLRPKNFKIGEEGHIYVFDFDKADQPFQSLSVLNNSCGKAMRTVKVLNEVREEPLNIERDRICERVQEIATTLQSSRHMNRILGTVELYDKLFSEETEESFEELFRNNITVFSNLES
jgi:hypothetical protein